MRSGRRFQNLVVIALLFVSAGSAWAEVCKGNQEKRIKQYDHQIFLSATDLHESETTHLRFGKPACNRYLYQTESVVCYDPKRRVALWAAYRLRDKEVVSKERRNSFRTDPRLTSEETAQCSDYAASGYDRGHVVPRDDMNRTFRAQAYTFYLSNMTPQSPELNQGMWRWLEERVRAWAKTYDEIYVITGSVFDSGQVKKVKSGNVGIPDKYYKIVLRLDNEKLVPIAIMLPNQMKGLPLPPGTQRKGKKVSAKEADTYLEKHLVSVGDVEKAAGVDLLPAIPYTTKEALAKAVASELWPRN